MPELSIDSGERKKADDLIEFVKRFFGDLHVDARFYFAIQMLRHLKPELDELKRRANIPKPEVPCAD